MVIEKKDIENFLPHRAPFVFVDEVAEYSEGASISARLFLDPSRAFFAGHFPGNPIMPGVLITESLAQTCGILLALDARAKAPEAQAKVFYLGSADVKFRSVARAGETLELDAKLVKKFGNLAMFSVEARRGRETIAAGTLSLAEPNGR